MPHAHSTPQINNFCLFPFPEGPFLASEKLIDTTLPPWETKTVSLKLDDRLLLAARTLAQT